MATKKQKREAGIAKQEAEAAKLKAQGLEAQKADRNERKMEVDAAVNRINQRYQNILDNATPEDWANAQKVIGESNG